MKNVQQHAKPEMDSLPMQSSHATAVIGAGTQPTNLDSNHLRDNRKFSVSTEVVPEASGANSASSDRAKTVPLMDTADKPDNPIYVITRSEVAVHKRKRKHELGSFDYEKRHSYMKRTLHSDDNHDEIELNQLKKAELLDGEDHQKQQQLQPNQDSTKDKEQLERNEQRTPSVKDEKPEITTPSLDQDEDESDDGYETPPSEIPGSTFSDSECAIMSDIHTNQNKSVSAIGPPKNVESSSSVDNKDKDTSLKEATPQHTQCSPPVCVTDPVSHVVDQTVVDSVHVHPTDKPTSDSCASTACEEEGKDYDFQLSLISELLGSRHTITVQDILLMHKIVLLIHRMHLMF